jgi:thiosulfate/3-mercaptopyruvate sulfurtransferase
LAETSPLIQAAELQALLAKARPPVLLEVRWNPAGPSPLECYRNGHLPGTQRVDLDADLAGPPGPGGRHPLPDVAHFRAAMRRVGVDADRPVVVYDHRDSTIAARLWWMLLYYGHRDVRVLDGGFDAWLRTAGPVERGDSAPAEPGRFTAVPGAMPLLTVEYVPSVAANGFLLDSRLGERFRGEAEPLDPVAGHIPGALSAPTFDNSDEDGLFRSAHELRQRFSNLGVVTGPPLGAYCGSGVTAAHQVLALRLAGFDAALYVGSWSEWVADPARPVAVGP